MIISLYRSGRYPNRSDSSKYHIEPAVYATTTDKIQICMKSKYSAHDVPILHSIIENATIRDQCIDMVVKINHSIPTVIRDYHIQKLLAKHKLPGFIEYIHLLGIELSHTDLKHVLIVPYFPEGPVRTYPWDETNLHILKGVLMQVVASMAIAYEKNGFIHGKLHLDNIFMKKSERVEITYCICGDHMVTVPTFGYEAVISDFDNSDINMMPIMNRNENICYCSEDHTSCNCHNHDQLFWNDMYTLMLKMHVDLPLSKDRKIIWNHEDIISFAYNATIMNEYTSKPTTEGKNMLHDISPNSNMHIKCAVLQYPEVLSKLVVQMIEKIRSSMFTLSTLKEGDIPVVCG